MKRGSKAVMIFACVVAVGALVSFIVMTLWNMILPAAVTGINPINFWHSNVHQNYIRQFQLQLMH